MESLSKWIGGGLEVHTVDNIADTFKSTTADRPFVGVQTTCLAVYVVHQEITSDVEERVDTRGNEG